MRRVTAGVGGRVTANVGAVHILIATDVDWIVEEITAALGDDDVHFAVCRDGRVVVEQVDDDVWVGGATRTVVSGAVAL